MRESDLGRALLEVFRAFEAEVGEAFVDLGFEDLRPSFAAVFDGIDPDGTRLTDLARRARITKQGMADIVGEMERHGLVRRLDHPEDGRSRLVVLTAKGKRRRAQSRKAVDRVEGRYRRRLGDRTYEALRDALAELGEGS